MMKSSGLKLHVASIVLLIFMLNLGVALGDELESAEEEGEAPKAQQTPKTSVARRLRQESLPRTENFWNLDILDSVRDNSYSYEYDGEGVNVYIIDSGLEENHPDFLPGQAKVIYTAEGLDTTTQDCTGHGSHVAGIVGGQTAGVAKKAKIHMLRVLDCRGDVSEEQVAKAINFVHANLVKPAVVSMSLGLDPKLATTIRQSTLLSSSLNKLISEDRVPVILSAGNVNSSNCSTLTETLGAIVVGATDSESRLAGFTNYGSCVSIFAPGDKIWSHALLKTKKKYKQMSGTSQAAPAVAGIVALLISANGNVQLSPEQAKQQLLALSSETSVLKKRSSQTIHPKMLTVRPMALAPLSAEAVDSMRAKLKSQSDSFNLTKVIIYSFIGSFLTICVIISAYLIYRMRTNGGNRPYCPGSAKERINMVNRNSQAVFFPEFITKTTNELSVSNPEPSTETRMTSQKNHVQRRNFYPEIPDETITMSAPASPNIIQKNVLSQLKSQRALSTEVVVKAPILPNPPTMEQNSHYAAANEVFSDPKEISETITVSSKPDREESASFSLHGKALVENFHSNRTYAAKDKIIFSPTLPNLPAPLTKSN